MVVGDNHQNLLSAVRTPDPKVVKPAGIPDGDLPVGAHDVVAYSPFTGRVISRFSFGPGGVCLVWGAASE